jgi:hypothetical protein
MAFHWSFGGVTVVLEWDHAFDLFFGQAPFAIAELMLCLLPFS